jgi:hypothetical protein
MTRYIRVYVLGQVQFALEQELLETESGEAILKDFAEGKSRTIRIGPVVFAREHVTHMARVTHD